MLPIAACSESANNFAPATVTKIVTVTASSGPAPSPFTPTYTPIGPGTTISRNGTFVVGTDIAPGTYKTAGPSDGMTICTWRRLSDLNNTDESTIDIGNEPGQAFVTVQPTDVAFYTQFCMPWQKIG
jgi:hypothetical protein